MAQIPNEIIEEIKNRSDIVQVISSFIKIKRSGSNYKAVCPFHKEKTPSFMISPQKQIFHCFGCHKGGNVFSFIMEYDSITFMEAVQKLAIENGVDLSQYQGSTYSSNRNDKETIINLNDKVSYIFEKSLFQNEIAYTYFSNRKLPDSIIKEFRLGYALDKWDYILNSLNKEETEIAAKAGLIIKKDGKAFDYFRHRVLFPIFNTQKNVIGFGGRRLNEAQNPKYLNSPDTIVYNKSYVLYGLSHAIDAIRIEKTCFFVEGYMDVLRMHQFGLKNVVATSGTALTEGHARLISRYCDTVFLIYDSDDAGLNATIRSIPNLLSMNIQINVIPLPIGADPDTILLKYGSEKFKHYASMAVDFIEFQFKFFSKKGLLKDNNEKAKILNQIKQQLSHVKNEILREIYKQKVEELFSIKLNEIKSLTNDIEIKNDNTDDFLSLLNKKENHIDREVLTLISFGNNFIISTLKDDLKPSIFNLKKTEDIINYLINEIEENGSIDFSKLILKSSIFQALNEKAGFKYSKYNDNQLLGITYSLKIKIIDQTIEHHKKTKEANYIEEINNLDKIKLQYKRELNNLIEQDKTNAT